MDGHGSEHKLAWLGHLAVFNALYACACVGLVGVWGGGAAWGGPRAVGAAAYAGLLALSVYLLDRVKPCDGWLDPSDLAAHPGRMALLWPRRRGVRVVMVACGIGAVAVGAWVGWELAVVAPLAWVGVIAYANRAIVSPRPKDILVVKNVAVGVAHAALAAVCVWASLGHDLRAVRPIVVGAGVLALVVIGDAALCDIPDRRADAAHDTRTFSVRFGVGAAWAIGWACVAGASVAMWAFGFARWELAGAGLIVTNALLMLVPVRMLRDAVDIRLALVAGVVMVAPSIGA